KTPRHHSVRFDFSKKGIYLFEVVRGDYAALCVKVIGTLEILFRRSGSAVLAVVSDGRGKPARSVRLRAFVAGRELPRGKELDDGAVFENAAPGDTVYLLAEKGPDVGLAVSPPLPAPPPSRPWVLPDRGLGRPGERISILGFAPSTAREPSLRVRSSGRSFGDKPLARSAGGFFEETVVLPPLGGEALVEVLDSPSGAVVATGKVVVNSWKGLTAFTARASKPVAVKGEKVTFHVEAAAGAKGEVAFLPFAYRIRRLAGRSRGMTLASGQSSLDARGRAEIVTPALKRQGTVRLELGPTARALAPAADVRVEARSIRAVLRTDQGFAEVGKPFGATLTLTDLEGKPVGGAEVRTFIEGAPFAMNTGKEGRTGTDGRFGFEVLFREKGEVVLTANAVSGRGIEVSATLDVAVSDGTILKGARQTLRVRNEAGPVQVLARGFGSPALVTFVDRSGAMRRVALVGEIAELDELPTEAGRIFVHGVRDGKRVEASISLGPDGPGGGVALDVRPGDPAGPKGELPVRVGAVAGAGFAVLATRTGGASQLVDEGSPVHRSQGGGSREFTSVGRPRVGPYRFLRPDSSARNPNLGFNALVEALDGAGATEFEIQRYLALPEGSAVIEMKARLARKNPLQALSSMEPPTVLQRDLWPRAGAGVPYSRLVWVRGRTGEDGRGRAGLAWDVPGDVVLTALASKGKHVYRTDGSATLLGKTGLTLSAPPFLRAGDKALVGISIGNPGRLPLEGLVRLGWDGEEDGGKGKAVVVPSGGIEVHLPLEGKKVGQTAKALFTGEKGAFEGVIPVTRLEGDELAERWLNVEPGDDGVISFSFPQGCIFEGAEGELHLAWGTDHLLFQGLEWAAKIRTPDTPSLAGKLIALAVAHRGVRGDEEQVLALRGRLLTEARTALSASLARRSPHGGFSMGSGQEEAPLATAAMAQALSEGGPLLGMTDDGGNAVLADRILVLLRDSKWGETTRAYLVLARALLSGPANLEGEVERVFPSNRCGFFSPVTLARLCLALRVLDGEGVAVKKFSEALRKTIVVRRGRLSFRRLEGPGRSEADPVLAAGLALQALAPFAEGDPLRDELVRFLALRRVGLGWGSPYRTAHVTAGLAAARIGGGGNRPSSMELNGHVVDLAWTPRGGFAKFPEPTLWEGGNFLVLTDPEGAITAQAIRIRSKGKSEKPGAIGITRQFFPLVKSGSTWRTGVKGEAFQRNGPMVVALKVELREEAEEIL
ncbi:MAG: alpha-2-macroglobulin family protein, partial [Planctomycetota bacterium]